VAREHLAVTSAFGMHYGALPWATIVNSAAPPVRSPKVETSRSQKVGK
jgi:hypothetical protein